MNEQPIPSDMKRMSCTGVRQNEQGVSRLLVDDASPRPPECKPECKQRRSFGCCRTQYHRCMAAENITLVDIWFPAVNLANWYELVIKTESLKSNLVFVRFRSYAVYVMDCVVRTQEIGDCNRFYCLERIVGLIIRRSNIRVEYTGWP